MIEEQSGTRTFTVWETTHTEREGDTRSTDISGLLPYRYRYLL